MSITINGDSGISGVNGTAATPALQGEDSNTGIVFGTDTVQISTGGNTRATVNSSGTLSMGSSSFSNTCIELESDTTAATFSIQNHTGSGKLFSGFDSPGNETVTILAAGSVTATNTCKAWVNCVHDGTVTDSFNVSSVTDNGSGDLTVNFTSSLANANYCMGGGAIYSNGPGTGFGVISIKEGDSSGNPETKTTSACRVKCGHVQSTSNSSNNCQITNTQAQIYMIFHGD